VLAIINTAVIVTTLLLSSFTLKHLLNNVSSEFILSDKYFYIKLHSQYKFYLFND